MEEAVDLQEYLDILPYPAFVLDCNQFEQRSGNDNPTAESITFIIVNKACSDAKYGGLVAKEIEENALFREWLCSNEGTTQNQQLFESADLEFTSNILRSTPLTLKSLTYRPIQSSQQSPSHTLATPTIHHPNINITNPILDRSMEQIHPANKPLPPPPTPRLPPLKRLVKNPNGTSRNLAPKSPHNVLLRHKLSLPLRNVLGRRPRRPIVPPSPTD
jgi:hypothetical protein